LLDGALHNETSSFFICRIPPRWPIIQIVHLLEICRMFHDFPKFSPLSFQPCLPYFLLNCPQHQILIPDYLWRDPTEGNDQLCFQFILMHHDQFTSGAILAGFAERHRSPFLNMDEEGELSWMGGFVTAGAGTQARAFMRIENE